MRCSSRRVLPARRGKARGPSDHLDPVGADHDAVLAQGLFQAGAEVLPPAGFQQRRHDLHHHDVVQGAGVGDGPGAAGGGAGLGGEAAEFLDKVVVNVGQRLFIETPAVIVVHGQKYLDQIHGRKGG